MQFKVPQFLEIEDKIFGPFTFKEFAYLAGGGGMCFVLYKLLGLYWGAVPILLVAGFALMLTFYRPNNKPFINMVEAMFHYSLQSKLYIWQRRKFSAEDKEAAQKKNKTDTEVVSREARLTGSKLRDLAWSLDVLDLKKET
ncbi:MAG: PrgI family protein [Candidatus Pacebacteria bacterium]|nr:PrgI family protein [Candidatus Paceibacterota bacterium]